jgi:hypothetical protein
MWQSFIYGVYWRHDDRMYYDEVHADSKEEAVEYFIEHKRDDVTLVRVELAGPNDGSVRQPAGLPILPFDPLMARRRLDRDENAR